MSFITNLFKSSKPKTVTPATPPSVSPGAGTDTTSASSAAQKTKKSARLALFATGGGAFGVTGQTPTARRKLLGN